MLKLLVAKGADINSKMSDNQYPFGGHTPLHQAAFRKKIGVVKILLDNGANINAKDDNGRTVIDIVRSLGHNDIAELLEAEGALSGYKKPN